MCCLLFFFFFQAEDGIRDIGVTGVQTCALPISPLRNIQRFLLDLRETCPFQEQKAAEHHLSHYYPFPALPVQSCCQTIRQKEEPAIWLSVPSIHPPF